MRMLLLASLLILSGCSLSSRDPAPESYRSAWDRFVVGWRLEGIFGYACTREEIHSGVKVLAAIPSEQCYRFNPPERIEGVWIDEFEGVRLLTNAQYDAGIRYIEDDSTWLEVKPADQRPGTGPPDYTPRVFRIVFIGRRSTYPGEYGHFGMSRHLVLLDRMISIEEITGK
jgi:hypothetical protein